MVIEIGSALLYFGLVARKFRQNGVLQAEPG
jgi:hypothetical protein